MTPLSQDRVLNLGQSGYRIFDFKYSVSHPGVFGSSILHTITLSEGGKEMMQIQCKDVSNEDFSVGHAQMLNGAGIRYLEGTTVQF